MKDGRIVLAVDERNVGTFRRFADNSAPVSDEMLIRYRIRNGQPKLATNAFFFQEKHGDCYREAKYGEFRSSPDGEVILVALRGVDLQKLGPKTTADHDGQSGSQKMKEPGTRDRGDVTLN